MDTHSRCQHFKVALLAADRLVVMATMASGKPTVDITCSLATLGVPPRTHTRGFLGNRTPRLTQCAVYFNPNKPFMWAKFKDVLVKKPDLVARASSLARGKFVTVTEKMKTNNAIATRELFLPRMLVLSDGSVGFLLGGDKTQAECLDYMRLSKLGSLKIARFLGKLGLLTEGFNRLKTSNLT